MDNFQLSDIVYLSDNTKGKIINITRSLVTYQIYHVQSLNDGSICKMTKHELVRLDNGSKSPSSGISPVNQAPELDIDLLHALFTEDFESKNTGNKQTLALPQVTELLSTTPQPPKQAPCQPLKQAIVSTRFIPVDETDVQQFIYENENQNTMRKTLGHVKLFQSFLLHNDEHRDIHTISPCDLDPLLSKFILSIRRKNGVEYEPSYIRGIIGSIERYLKRHRYEASIIRGVAFTQTQETMKSKQKFLKKMGKGNRPRAADAITDSEIDKLYEVGQLGTHNPTALINTLWINNTIHFGIRGGGEEHRALCLGDFKLYFDDELKTEYIEFNERQTKTRTGIDLNNIRDKSPRMYANQGSTCPV